MVLHFATAFIARVLDSGVLKHDFVAMHLWASLPCKWFLCVIVGELFSADVHAAAECNLKAPNISCTQCLIVCIHI